MPASSHCKVCLAPLTPDASGHCAYCGAILTDADLELESVFDDTDHVPADLAATIASLPKGPHDAALFHLPKPHPHPPAGASQLAQDLSAGVYTHGAPASTPPPESLYPDMEAPLEASQEAEEFINSVQEPQRR